LSRLILSTFLLLIVSLFPTFSSAQTVSEHYEKGVQSYAEQDYPEAFIHLKNALQMDGGFIPARVLLAKLYFNSGDIAGAVKEAEEALRLGADINVLLRTYGTGLLLLDRSDELFALEERASSFSEQNQFEWMLLQGQGYMLTEEFAAAREQLERAATTIPEDVRSHNLLASLSMREKQFDEAARLIEKSLVLEPDNVKTYELRAELAIAQGDYEAGLADLNTAFELDSEDIRILRALARVHMLLGNQEESSNYLELLFEQSPYDPAAMILSAIVELQTGDTALGNSILTELSLKLAQLDLVLPETNDKLLFFQATADYLRGGDRNAITLFNEYLSRNPEDLAAIKFQSELYIRNEEFASARELLSNQREVISEDLNLSVQLLRLYIGAGLDLSARELLEELRPRLNDPLLIAMLEAELLRSQGRAAEALQHLELSDYSKVPVSYALLRGALLLQLNQLPAAYTVAQELQSTYPTRTDVHNFAATTYLKNGDADAAQSAIEAALELSVNNIEARFNKAVLLKFRGDLEDASLQANGILVDKPGHIGSIMLVAGILYEQGNETDAIEWSRKVYAYDKVSPLPDEFLLSIYTKSENWDGALKAALQLAKTYPLNESYLIQQAEIYIQLKDFETAQHPLRGLFSLWEGDADKLLRLAELQILTKSLRDARISLKTALKLAPNLYPARMALVNLDILEKNFEVAVGQLDELEKTQGPTSEIFLARGDIALAQGNPEAAQADFLKAYEIELTPDTVKRLYNLAGKDVGTDAFINALESKLNADSLPPWAIRSLANILMKSGEKPRAQKYYEMVLEYPQFQNDALVLNNLANLYAESDLGKALETAMRALGTTQDSNYAVLDTVGWILTRQKKYDEALPYLRRAFSINSRDPEVRYHTAVALVGLGRDKEAEAELSAALATRRDFPGREEAEALHKPLAAQLAAEKAEEMAEELIRELSEEE
jgi:putative PEP-CTERM system TPR-repeat lipoprotein